ncbi:MAG: SCO family protein [Hyphomicrobiales bacterium]
MNRIAAALLVFIATINSLSALAAKTSVETIRESQEVIGQTVPNLVFTDTRGAPLPLSSMRGKPLIVNLVYTGCADACPAIVEKLAPAISAARDALGEGSFAVLTIGFDTRNDTPQRMRAFAAAHNAGAPDWIFASGDAVTVATLSDAIGFSIDQSAGGFAHAAQVTILDRYGKVFAQVYGEDFATPAIVEPLKDAVWGRGRPLFSLAGLADRVKLYCTVYDPNTGRYHFSYALFLSIAMGLTSLGAVLVVLVRETRRTIKSGGA